MSYADYCSRRNECDYCHERDCVCHTDGPDPEHCFGCGSDPGPERLCPLDVTECNCCAMCAGDCFARTWEAAE